jgi:hypothetical protein
MNIALIIVDGVGVTHAVVPQMMDKGIKRWVHPTTGGDYAP